jgi:hypothetical protein
MHGVQQRRSRVLIYTNYDGDDIDLGGDDDDAIDDEDDTSPHAKEVLGSMQITDFFISTQPRIAQGSIY